MSVNGAKMARLGSARLGSARRVVLHLLLSVSSSIALNYCVKSENRVYYALISDFFFCGKGAYCRNFTPKCQVLRMFLYGFIDILTAAAIFDDLKTQEE